MKNILYIVLCVIVGGLSASAQAKKKKKKPKAQVVYYQPSKQKKKVKIKYIPPPPPKRYDFSQYKNSSNPIEQIFRSDSFFYNDYLSQSAERRVQIVYTRIDRDRYNNPHFIDYVYRADANEYFYPASTVKLPLTAMCLEKINQLNIEGLTKETALTIDSSGKCQYASYYDSSSANYQASLGHYIKKILLVSDNDAYNRMYEFMGPSYINKRFKQLGMPSARVTHRFTPGCTEEDNMITNRFKFYDTAGNIIYTQEPITCMESFEPPTGQVLLGTGYIDYDGKLKKYPKDFTGRNFFQLQDIHLTLKKLMFPDAFRKDKRFDLSEMDYRFLRKYMSMYAPESIDPVYDSMKGNFNCIKKYLIYGQNKDTAVNKNLRIFNIVGFAYGFLVDVAYIIDLETNTEFMLSSAIYSNTTGVLNTGIYEYYTIGMPFLKRLGQDFLKMEQKRPKLYPPNLDYLKFDYGKE
ncbi:MAG: serine hydrolase [Bacteroidota bacterium]|nr:serine hydrolase [Bacteroidota bacterium]